MRASATAPSLATSNASRNDLASLQSARAATLLTRVASYSTAQQNYEREHRQSIGSACSSGQGSPASSDRKEPFEIVIQQSGNYYSFPSFEGFQEYHDQNERHENGIR